MDSKEKSLNLAQVSALTGVSRDIIVKLVDTGQVVHGMFRYAKNNRRLYSFEPEAVDEIRTVLGINPDGASSSELHELRINVDKETARLSGEMESLKRRISVLESDNDELHRRNDVYGKLISRNSEDLENLHRMIESSNLANTAGETTVAETVVDENINAELDALIKLYNTDPIAATTLYKTMNALREAAVFGAFCQKPADGPVMEKAKKARGQRSYGMMSVPGSEDVVEVKRAYEPLIATINTVCNTYGEDMLKHYVLDRNNKFFHARVQDMFTATKEEMNGRACREVMPGLWMLTRGCGFDRYEAFRKYITEMFPKAEVKVEA